MPPLAAFWSLASAVLLLLLLQQPAHTAARRLNHRKHNLKPMFNSETEIPAWVLMQYNISEISEFIAMKNATGLSKDDKGILSSLWGWIFGGGSGGSGGGVSSGGGGTSSGVSNEISVEDAESPGTPVNFPTCDCRCGTANSRLRIVGGLETRVKQYPWMTMLLYDDRFYCGGTLINSKYILTAAHCVKGFSARRMKIRLLEHNRDSTFETSIVERNVVKIIHHNRYNPNTFNNDIALLRLDKEVPIRGDLSPACMPLPGKRYTNDEGLVTGWGKTAENKPVSTVLREVTVPILSNSKCGAFYGHSQITDNMLCAGFKEGGKDSCQGDSGGPLIVKNDTVHRIVGVVSWGEGCARPSNPGVYARVNRYLTWIKSNTADACYCKDV